MAADALLQLRPADFGVKSARLERRGGTPARIRTDDGDYDGYQMPDGSLIRCALRTPSASFTTTIAAQETARTTDATKRQNALTVVRNQVARVRAIAAGSRTDQDRWLLALSFLLMTEE